MTRVNAPKWLTSMSLRNQSVRDQRMRMTSERRTDESAVRKKRAHLFCQLKASFVVCSTVRSSGRALPTRTSLSLTTAGSKLIPKTRLAEIGFRSHSSSDSVARSLNQHDFVTPLVPTPLAAYRKPACHGRHTHCLPALLLASTCARCGHRQRRNTHRIHAS